MKKTLIFVSPNFTCKQMCAWQMTRFVFVFHPHLPSRPRSSHLGPGPRAPSYWARGPSEPAATPPGPPPLRGGEDLLPLRPGGQGGPGAQLLRAGRGLPSLRRLGRPLPAKASEPPLLGASPVSPSLVLGIAASFTLNVVFAKAG